MLKIEIIGQNTKELCEQLKELIGALVNEPRSENKAEAQTAQKGQEPAPQATPAQEMVKELKQAAPSVDDCRQVYIKATEAGVDKAAIKAILTDLKAPRITELSEEVRGEFIRRINSLIDSNAK